MAKQPANLLLSEYEVHLIKLYVKEPGVDALDLSDTELGMKDLEVILESLIKSQVTDLNLQGNDLNGGMERLAELLVKTKIRTLNISDCRLSNTDMMHLMKVVNNSEITSLDISHNKFEPDISFMEEIASCLVSSKITNLNVSRIFAYGTSRPPVFSVLFSSLPSTAVKELHVANNYLSVAELQVLGQSLKDSEVEVLDLSHNWFSNDGLNALIPGLVNSRVSKLNLSGNGILDFRNLAKCMKDTQIKSLNIANQNFRLRTEFPFFQFPKGSCLEDLSVDNSAIGEEVSHELMRSLKCLNLKKLNLFHASFKYDSVSEFASVIQSTSITDISFSHCGLPIEALYILGECLAGSKLTCINLSWCFRNEKEAAVLGAAMASIIERTKGSCVNSLNLSGNRIGEVGANMIVPKLAQTTFTHFDLFYCHIGNGVLSIVTNLKFTSITHLNLSGNYIKDADAISFAKHLKETQVSKLDLSLNEITSEGAKALAAHLKDTKLLSLNLCSNKIDSDGLEALAAGAENTLITQLDVFRNPGATPIICRIILHVLWKNRASVQPFIHTFKLLAPTGTDNILQFDRNVDSTDIDSFLDKVLVLYETIVKKPHFVHILAKEKNISLSSSEILTLMLDEFPKQLSSFISRSIEADLSQHISLLKRVEDSGLSGLVESLLLNRPTYIIDEEQGILHPYVYTLLNKYKQPLYNLSIDPEFKTKLIEYFTEHADLEYASDVVNLLRNK